MPLTTAPVARLNRISQESMCIGCGLCQSIAGEHLVKMQVVRNGYLRPVVVGDLSHKVVDAIVDVCPGTRVEGLPEHERRTSTRQDVVWGCYQSMHLAHAADPEVRYRGSTGGVLSALGMYLLDSGEVECVLHTRASRTYPSFGERTVSTTAAEVLAAAGSRYGPTAPLLDVLEQLDKQKPFAFVGKPCDVAAVRNLAQVDGRVDRWMKYLLAPVCGGFMPPHAMKRFLTQEVGVSPERVTELRYRGHGCPGPTRVTLDDGRVVEKSYTEFWGTDESQWALPFRCKVCPDGIGESADIAAADTWLGGSPDPETEHQDPGSNAVLVRTERGQSLLERATQAGYLQLGEAVTPRYMDRVQPHQRRKKISAGARLAGLRIAGLTAPVTARLRLDELGEMLDATETRRQFSGAQQRARAAREETPKPAVGEPKL